MISALSGFTFAIDVSIFKFTGKKVFSYVIVKRALNEGCLLTKRARKRLNPINLLLRLSIVKVPLDKCIRNQSTFFGLLGNHFFLAFKTCTFAFRNYGVSP